MQVVQELLSPLRVSRSEALALCQRYLRSRWKRWRLARCFLPRERSTYLVALLAWHELVRDRMRSSPPGVARAPELDRLSRAIEHLFDAEPDTPIGIALEPAVRLHKLPALAFRGPLEELRRAEHVRTFETRGALLAHARALAAPEARLLLSVLDKQSEKNEIYAEALALGLQLVAWLTRLSRDLEHGCLHLAIEDLSSHGLGILDLRSGVTTERSRALVRDQIAWTRSFIAKGWPLVHELGRVRGRALAFVLRWHAASLSALEARGYDVFRGPPPAGRLRLLACATASLVSRRAPNFGVALGVYDQRR